MMIADKTHVVYSNSRDTKKRWYVRNGDGGS